MLRSIRTVRFPCVYKRFGCHRTFLARSKAAHEEICEYRPHPCPYRTPTCTWQGRVHQLFTHFQQDHPTLTFHDTNDMIFIATNVDTAQSSDWVTVLQCFGYYFLLRLTKQGENERTLLIAMVQIIGTRLQADQFIYTIELKCHRRRLVWETTPHPTRENIATAIRDANCLIFDTSITDQTTSSRRKFVNSLTEICSIKNWRKTMEEVTPDIRYPCTYASFGCPETFLMCDKPTHEEVCEFRGHPCPYPDTDCGWEGRINQLFDHFQQEHPDVVFSDTNDLVLIATHVNVADRADLVTILECFGHYFILTLKKQCENDGINLVAILKIIGTRDEAEQFIYSFELKFRKRRLIWETTPHPSRERLDYKRTMNNSTNPPEYPCMYEQLGCNQWLQLKDKPAHENICEYRLGACPYRGSTCTWQGEIHEVLDHLLAVHKEITVIDTNDATFVALDIHTRTAADWVMIQNCFGHHFMLIVIKQEYAEEDHTNWIAIVQLIGGRAQANQFVYRLELNGPRKRRLIWESTPHSSREPITDAIRESSCLIFDKGIAQLFSEGGNLRIKVIISKAND
ncbi:putative E3 ubiquitin-protein ligase [Trypoxylus dichotomus]